MDRAQRLDLLARARQVRTGHEDRPAGAVRVASAARRVRTQNVADGAWASGPSCRQDHGTPCSMPTGTTTSSSSVADAQRRDQQVPQPGDPQVGARASGVRGGAAARVGQPAQGEQQRPQLGRDVLLGAELHEPGPSRLDDDRDEPTLELPELDQRPAVERLAERRRAGQPRQRSPPGRRPGPRGPVGAEHRGASSRRRATRRARRRRRARAVARRGDARRRDDSDAGERVSSAAARVRSIHASALAGDAPASTTPEPDLPELGAVARRERAQLDRGQRRAVDGEVPQARAALREHRGRVPRDARAASAPASRPRSRTSTCPLRASARARARAATGVARPVRRPSATRPATRYASTALCRLPGLLEPTRGATRDRELGEARRAAPAAAPRRRSATARSRHAGASLTPGASARPRPRGRLAAGEVDPSAGRCARAAAAPRSTMSGSPDGLELLDRAGRRGRRLGEQPQVHHRVGVLRVVLPQRDAGVDVRLRRRGRSRACPRAAARPAPRSTRGVWTSGAEQAGHLRRRERHGGVRGVERLVVARRARRARGRGCSSRSPVRARRPGRRPPAATGTAASGSASRPAFCSTTARESPTRPRNRARSAGSIDVRPAHRQRARRPGRAPRRARVAQLLQDRRAAGQDGGLDVPDAVPPGDPDGLVEQRDARTNRPTVPEMSQASTRRLSPSSSGSFRRTCDDDERPAPGAPPTSDRRRRRPSGNSACIRSVGSALW